MIHDLRYCDNRLPQIVCDALFYEMLLVAGADKRRAGLIHLGLRIGGGTRYAVCAGGMRVEDLAFELMLEQERGRGG